MEDLFGKLTAPALMGLIVLLAQIIKQRFGLEGRRADVLAIALNYALLAPYCVLSGLPAHGVDLAWVVFGAMVYPLFGWLFTSGAYSKIVKPMI